MKTIIKSIPLIIIFIIGKMIYGHFPSFIIGYFTGVLAIASFMLTGELVD